MDYHFGITGKNDLLIHNDCKLSIKYIHKKDRCRSSFRRVLSRMVRKISVPIDNASSRFSAENLVQKRGMETGPKEDDKGKGKVYLTRRDQKILAYFIEQNDSSAGPQSQHVNASGR